MFFNVEADAVKKTSANSSSIPTSGSTDAAPLLSSTRRLRAFTAQFWGVKHASFCRKSGINSIGIKDPPMVQVIVTTILTMAGAILSF